MVPAILPRAIATETAAVPARTFYLIFAMIAFASATVLGLIASGVLPAGTPTCSVR